MDILAHRGFWRTKDQKNSICSLMKAVELGYGIETDVRDYCGKLVISHDVADSKSPLFEELLSWYAGQHKKTALAINIKADGLQRMLRDQIEAYSIENYFLFDMSVPEQVVYVENQLKVYTRQSDVENTSVLLQKAEGIWLDAFYDSAYLTVDRISECLSKAQKCCIVSPELHGYPHIELWEKIKKTGLDVCSSLQLCTDIPNEAEVFFNEKNQSDSI